MKKICLLSLILTFSNLFSDQIESYQELISAIRAGNRFVILTDLQQCTGKASMPTGYLTPKAMMLIPTTETSQGRVVTSDLHFTDHLDKPTYEYVKYTSNSDGTVQIQTTFYDPQNFKPMGTAHTINCSLRKGIEIHTEKLPCQ